MLWLWAALLNRSPERMVLSADSLSYRSGLPLIGRWLNLTDPLPVLRQTPMHWGGHPLLVGSMPERTRILEWRNGPWRARRIRVALWLPEGSHDTAATVRRAPLRHFGLVRWRTPENLAALTANLQALPLARALQAQGVPIPLVGIRNRRSSALHSDVTQHPRLRWGALAVFVILFVAAALVPIHVHQDFATPLPTWMPVLLGLAAGAIAWLALWPGSQGGERDLTWSARELRWTRLGLAALIGVVSVFCLPSIALGLVAWTQPAEVHQYRLAQTPEGEQLMAEARRKRL